jgi:hypothetical protein
VEIHDEGHESGFDRRSVSEITHPDGEVARRAFVIRTPASLPAFTGQDATDAQRVEIAHVRRTDVTRDLCCSGRRVHTLNTNPTSVLTCFSQSQDPEGLPLPMRVVRRFVRNGVFSVLARGIEHDESLFRRQRKRAPIGHVRCIRIFQTVNCQRPDSLMSGTHVLTRLERYEHTVSERHITRRAPTRQRSDGETTPSSPHRQRRPNPRRTTTRDENRDSDHSTTEPR